MTRLAADVSERISVDCPEHEASNFLEAFIADHQTLDGAVQLMLRSPTRKLTERRQPTERPVVATLHPLTSSDGRYPTYSISWLSPGDGASPEFIGALAVEKPQGEDGFGLILSGHYEPVGTVRILPNATQARRIARVSARDVLRCIAEFIENARAHKDAAFAGHRRFIHAVPAYQ